MKIMSECSTTFPPLNMMTNLFITRLEIFQVLTFSFAPLPHDPLPVRQSVDSRRSKIQTSKLRLKTLNLGVTFLPSSICRKRALYAAIVLFLLFTTASSKTLSFVSSFSAVIFHSQCEVCLYLV